MLLVGTKVGGAVAIQGRLLAPADIRLHWGLVISKSCQNSIGIDLMDGQSMKVQHQQPAMSFDIISVHNIHCQPLQARCMLLRNSVWMHRGVRCSLQTSRHAECEDIKR